MAQRGGDRRKSGRFAARRRPAGEQRLAHAARAARLRSTSVCCFLRKPTGFGVISISLSSMNSSACSQEALIPAWTRLSSQITDASGIADRECSVLGKRVRVRGELGGGGLIKKKRHNNPN